MELITIDNVILLKKDLNSKEDLFRVVADVAKNMNLIDDENLIIETLLKREEEGSTGFEKGIAIPHARVPHLKAAQLFFLRTNPMDWDSLDGEKSNNFFVILVPEDLNSATEHLTILATISSSLMDDQIITLLNSLKTKVAIFDFIKTKILKKNELNDHSQEVQPTTDYYVAVSACTFGLSHTYMAEKKMLDYAKAHNINIKIETRGAQGIKNKITPEEYQNAKAVILAVDKEIDTSEIDNSNIVKVRTIDVIKNVDKVFEQTVIKKNKTKVAFENFFKIKLAQSSMSSASGVLNYFQWIAIFIGFVILIHSFNGMNDHLFGEITQIIQLGTLAVPSVGAFYFVKYFTKTMYGSSLLSFLLLGFNIYGNLNFTNADFLSLGLITAFILSWIAIIWEKVFIEFAKKLTKYNRFNSCVKWFLQLGLVTILFIILYFGWTDLSHLNSIIYNFLTKFDNDYWWFRWIVAFAFIYMMFFDMGGPINKWSIILSALLFCDSATLNVENIFATPLTAEVLGITMPGASLWFRYLLFKKTMSTKEQHLSLKSGVGAYKGISENSLWTFKYYNKITTYFAHCFVAIFIAALIGLMHIRYFGGYNFILGSIVGLSFDNVLNNEFFNVLPNNAQSFNLGFLIVTSFGVFGSSLIYACFFNPKSFKKQA